MFPQLLHRHPRTQAIRFLEGGEPRQQPFLERPRALGGEQPRLAAGAPGGDHDLPGLPKRSLQARDLGPRPAETPRQGRVGRPPEPGLAEEPERRLPIIPGGQRRHRFPGGGTARGTLRRGRVHHRPATDGDDGRVAAQDEAVAAERRQRAFEPQLNERRLTRPQGLHSPEQPHPRQRRGRAGMHMDPVLVGDRRPEVRQRLQVAIQHPPGAEFPREPHDRAAFHPLPADAGEVQRHPLPGGCGLRRRAVDFEAADPGAVAAGQDLHFRPDRDLPRNERSGDHRAEAAHREHPVHRQAEQPLRVPGGSGGGGGGERGAQVVQPGAGERGHRDHRGRGEGAPGEQVADFESGQLDQVRVLDQVAAAERHHGGLDAQQAADLEMLPGLRHHRLVRGDHQQHHIEPAGPGEHVADEPLVPGHIHEGVAHAPGLEVGEAEVHGDPPRLLLLEPIRIGSGEGANQRALPVVYVAGGADHHMAHRRRL